MFKFKKEQFIGCIDYTVFKEENLIKKSSQFRPVYKINFDFDIALRDDHFYLLKDVYYLDCIDTSDLTLKKDTLNTKDLNKNKNDNFIIEKPVINVFNSAIHGILQEPRVISVMSGGNMVYNDQDRHEKIIKMNLDQYEIFKKAIDSSVNGVNKAIEQHNAYIRGLQKVYR